VVKLTDLRPAKGATKRNQRLGRGVSAGQGKSAGKGSKGQHSRRNGTKAPYFEGGQLPLIRRIPFKRGFTNIFKIRYQEVNLETLAETFKTGQVITIDMLFEKRLIRDPEKPVAILGNGELRGAMTIEAHRFSGTARAKIEAQGGEAVQLKMLFIGARATVKLLRKDQIEKIKAAPVVPPPEKAPRPTKRKRAHTASIARRDLRSLNNAKRVQARADAASQPPADQK